MSRPSVTAERRREILEATCEVVSDRGFRDLRIVDVAKRAGLSSGTVHYYFDSKEVLLREAFSFQYEESQERRALAIQPDDDPVTRLRKLADGYLPSSPATIRSWRVWMELWVSALRDPSMSGVNDVYYGEWRQSVLDAFLQGRDSGVMKIEDPLLCANTYVSMMDGLAIQVLIGAAHLDVADMRTTCQAYVDGLVIDSSHEQSHLTG